MDWFDNLIPAGIFRRGVQEFDEDFDGFPALTEFLLLLVIVFFILLAVSIDSWVIREVPRRAMRAL